MRGSRGTQSRVGGFIVAAPELAPTWPEVAVEMRTAKTTICVCFISSAPFWGTAASYASQCNAWQTIIFVEPVAVLLALGVHLTDGVDDKVRLVKGNIFRALVRE
jgi:hypothetical protein